MKKKNFGRKTCGLFLSALSIVMPFIVSPNKVEAKECKQHTNYYFYIDVASEYSWTNALVGKTRSHVTSFPNIIPENATDFTYDTVTLTRESVERTTSSWSLSDFWKYYNIAFSTGKKYYDTGEIAYLAHGDWYLNGNESSSDGVAWLSGVTESKLAAASIIPSTYYATVNISTSNMSDTLLSTVTRKYREGDINGVTPDYLYSNDYKSYAVPTLAYIQYNVCEDETPTPAPVTKYKVTVNFLDKSTRSQIKDSKVVGSNYIDGQDYNADCDPTIGDYKLVSSAHLSGKISGKDVVLECLYEKTSSGGAPSNPSNPGDGNTGTNPGTADMPIYIVWAIGIGALGYAVYYFNKYYGTHKDEV